MMMLLRVQLQHLFLYGDDLILRLLQQIREASTCTRKNMSRLVKEEDLVLNAHISEARRGGGAKKPQKDL